MNHATPVRNLNQEEAVDRMSFQLPKQLGKRLREFVERRNLNLSAYIRQCVEEGLERQAATPRADGRMMLAVGMSAELSCALRELARLHGCSVEDATRRLLLEHVGQALTLAHTELDKLRQVLRGTPTADDPPPSDEAEPSVDEED